VSIISVTQPVFTAAIAIIIGMDMFETVKCLGIALAIAGSLVMLNLREFSWDGTTIGNLLMILQCLSVAVYNIMTRWLVQQGSDVIHWAIVCVYTLIFGTLGMAAMSSYHLIQINLWTHIPAMAWLAIVYSIAFAAVLYVGFAWVLKRVSPTICSSFMTLQPILSGILASVILGEQLVAIQYVGGALVVAGLALVVIPIMPSRWQHWNKCLRIAWCQRRNEAHEEYLDELRARRAVRHAEQHAAAQTTRVEPRLRPSVSEPVEIQLRELPGGETTEQGKPVMA
jgi:drug/metabolite transporter (DMT)-like permease